MKRGFSAESPRASLTLLMAPATARSKSTLVLAPQTLRCNSSRVTTSPDFSSRIVSTLNGCAGSLILCPAFQSSPACRSTSNSPNAARSVCSVVDTGDTPALMNSTPGALWMPSRKQGFTLTR